MICQPYEVIDNGLAKLPIIDAIGETDDGTNCCGTQAFAVIVSDLWSYSLV